MFRPCKIGQVLCSARLISNDAGRVPYLARTDIGRCYHIQTPAGGRTICDHANIFLILSASLPCLLFYSLVYMYLYEIQNYLLEKVQYEAARIVTGLTWSVSITTHNHKGIINKLDVI